MSIPERLLNLGPHRVRMRLETPEIAPVVDHLYAGFPRHSADALADFTVGVRASGFLRRFIRQDAIGYCDTPAPFVPLPRESAMVVLEMILNWQCGMGSFRFLTLHAGVVAKGDAAVILPGLSGAGKSTLSIGLGYAGWRYFADEYALIGLEDGLVYPYPRPASLKNASIDIIAAQIGADAMSPRYPETAKGIVAYARAPADAVAAMAIPATPKLIAFPHFAPDAAPRAEPVIPTEALVLLINGSPNYLKLGALGFQAMTRLVRDVPAYRIHYARQEQADQLLQELLSRD
jgi:HprK-related kinase A